MLTKVSARFIFQTSEVNVKVICKLSLRLNITPWRRWGVWA